MLTFNTNFYYGDYRDENFNFDWKTTPEVSKELHRSFGQKKISVILGKLIISNVLENII